MKKRTAADVARMVHGSVVIANTTTVPLPDDPHPLPPGSAVPNVFEIRYDNGEAYAVVVTKIDRSQ